MLKIFNWRFALAVCLAIVIWGVVIWVLITFVMPHFTFWKP